VHQLGGYKTQAKSAEAARQLVTDAHILEEAGCYALVLEAIPDRLAELVSQRLKIPTIGIGAGPGCDGQVLVTHDLLGLFDRFTPKFVKQYASLQAEMARAFAAYLDDVKTHHFPGAEHTYPMEDGEFRELLALLETERVQ
jgi:3-methyl-2-oxobutanoate hydroxymethyltransferase